MDDELRDAIRIAQAGGQELRVHFGRPLRIATKSSAVDLVTDADKAAEARIAAELRQHFPDDGIVAEESGNLATGTRRWIVDPLDGTTNFAHNFPHFCVSIALYEGDLARVGVVHDPLRNETFYARSGHGAWLLDRDGATTRLHVTKVTELQSCLLATGFAYSRATTPTNNLSELAAMVPKIQGVRRAGSAALDLAYVAAGRLDGYWEYHLAPWDWAAGALLVAEAGGATTTLGGEPWHLAAQSIAVANQQLLDAMLQTLTNRP